MVNKVEGILDDINLDGEFVFEEDEKGYNNLTDMEKLDYGLIRLEDTWFYKKALAYAKEVRAGKYGCVIREHMKNDGWGDSIQFPHFTVIRENKLVKLYTCESGIFRQSKTGGSINITGDVI